MKAPAEDNESTDKTESFDEESSDDQIKEEPAEKSYDDVLIISKKNVATSTQNVRKRKTRKQCHSTSKSTSEEIVFSFSNF